MEKSSSSAAAGTTNTFRSAPVGAATSTASGVTVYDNVTPAMNQVPPPSYDQATGAATITTTTTHHNINYSTSPPSQHQQQQQQQQQQWGPGGPTQYVAYATPASSSTTTYTYAAVQPRPPPVAAHIHQQQPGLGQPPVVIIQQPMLPLGPEPVFLTCPACHVQKLTRIEFEPSTRTHLMAALLCLFGLWCCVCLPYCAGSCMNTQHYCGNCGKYLGSYGNTL